MLVVKINVTGAELTPRQPVVTSGSCGTVRVEFTFDGEWQGLSKTAVFNTAKGNWFVVIENGICEFPAEALSAAADVGIGVFGTDGTRTLTSLFCKVRVSHGTPTTGERAANYVPGIYEQLYAKLERAEKLSVTAVAGNEAAATITDENGVYLLTLTLPKGNKGDRGPMGRSGRDGADGYTPVCGVDYWTEEDKTALTNELLYMNTTDGESIPYVGGLLSFASEEEFASVRENADWYNNMLGAAGNFIVMIGGIPKYIRIGEPIFGDELIPFTAPMTASERAEIESGFGDVAAALDAIAAIQEEHIGGNV